MKIIRMMLVLSTFSVAAQQMNKQELLQRFAQPITFNRANIETFLTDVFNHQLYGTYCLPSNFMHIADFLSHNKDVEHPRDFAISIFNLFHTRLKESFWVNPYALAQIIEVTAQQCASLCEPVTNQTLHAEVKKTLYNAMLSRFQELKNDPEYFMNNLAHEIVTVVGQHDQEGISELQNSISRFIESALDKIIWDPREQESCWESCKLIAEQLLLLHEARIIRSETVLNQCYWSLVYRFAYFLETAGEHLTPDTYTIIKQDLLAQDCALLKLEEQEHCLQPKAKRLQLAVLEGEVKARALQAGMIL